MSLVILDRDGVINQDSDQYIRSSADWQPIPGSIEAIVALSRAGYRVAVATNQSGLSRGYFSLDDLEAIHATLCQQVENQGGEVAGVFYCPHLPEEACSCRKPATGLLSAIESELGEAAAGAWFIGDSLKDLQAAQAFGCIPVLVKTGNGAGTLNTLHSAEPGLSNPHSIAVYTDLAAAAGALLAS
jgi:D-glycero-D-manno-heptose 1,7-bisphosphate phosphatase